MLRLAGSIMQNVSERCISEITPYFASREIEEEGLWSWNTVETGSFNVRPFFPQALFADRGWTTRRDAGYEAGDLKYGHVDAKNIGARYIQFIYGVYRRPEAHTGYSIHENKRPCAPSEQW